MNKEKVRLSVDCTIEERRYIKMLAAREGKSISEYLLSFTRKEMPKKPAVKFSKAGRVIKSKQPNKKSEKVLKDTEQGKNLESHGSLNDFWQSMGMNVDAED